MKLLQIGASLNCGAPGRISEQIGLLAIKNGWDVYMAHGLRYSRDSQLNSISVVTQFGERMHALYSLLFDRHGLGPQSGTKALVEWIKVNQPDVIHLHNIHGYFLNYKVLFEYLQTTDIPIVWTLHDCWPLTGHCAYFDSISCEKWKKGCFECSLKGEYPRSLFVDRSDYNYQLKKTLFTSIGRCVIVPVSEWLGQIAVESFMGKYPVHVIHNGVDINTFKPIKTDLKKRLGISDSKIVVLGVAAPWVPRKGYKDMIRISREPGIQVIMVGVDTKQQNSLPKNIISIARTANVEELVEYYNIADVFVNPTYSDNFPTTNIEALACGKPVITYDTGGAPEAIDGSSGVVVRKGDVDGIIKAIYSIMNGPDYAAPCRNRAEKFFDKDVSFKDYISIYNTLVGR